MNKQKEIMVTVGQSDVEELERLIDGIVYPNVTFEEDILVMAQQAIRFAKAQAIEARHILYRWRGLF